MEAKIAAIKERQALEQAKADPGLHHAGVALKAIDKALAATAERRSRQALLEARVLLSSALSGVIRATERPAADLPEVLLSYVRNNPGQRGEQIAAAMVTDATAIRPALKQLIAEGLIRTEGQKRGTRYSAV